MYTIGLDLKELDLLVQIKAFFKAGNIYTSKRGVVYYTVGSSKRYSKIHYTSFWSISFSYSKIKRFYVI